MTLLPMLREIDLRIGLDESLALRRIGRERRQERSRKGWATRHACERALQVQFEQRLREARDEAGRKGTLR